MSIKIQLCRQLTITLVLMLIGVSFLDQAFPDELSRNIPKNKPLLRAAYSYAQQADVPTSMKSSMPSLLEQTIFERIAETQAFFETEFNPVADQQEGANNNKPFFEGWRQQVFNKLSRSQRPAIKNFIDEARSITEYNERTRTERDVKRIIFGESLKYMQNKISFLDMIIKPIRVEISDKTFRRESDKAAPRSGSRNESRSPGRKNQTNNDEVTFKAGLGVKFEHKWATLTADSEAQYRNLSAFVKVSFAKQTSAGLGLKYPFADNLQIVYNHLITYDETISGEANSRAVHYDLVVLNYAF